MQSSSASVQEGLFSFRGYFFSQPHQPFFTSGVILAILFMLIFGLAYKGVLTLSIPVMIFHVYGLVFLIFSQFFIGFLFTTFPRFCQSEIIAKREFITIFLLYQTGTVLFIAGAFFSQALVEAGVVIAFLAHLASLMILQRIYRESNPALRTDPFWILIAFYFGVVSHFIFLAGYGAELLGVNTDFIRVSSSPIAMNMYLIFMVFAVAQRMVPFFSHSFEPKDPHLIRVIFTGFVLKTLLAIAGWIIAESLLDIFLGLYIVREFIRWKLPVFHSPAILWILHLALFWLPVALIVGGLFGMLGWWLESSFSFLQTHLLALGVLTTILIGFGTRVTLGHSGQPPEADSIARALFWMTQAVLLSRFFYSLNSGFGFSAFWFFDLSMALWLLLFILWFWRYGPVLLRGKVN